MSYFALACIAWFLCGNIVMALALGLRKLRNWDEIFFDWPFIFQNYRSCIILGPALLFIAIVRIFIERNNFDTKEKYVMRKMER